MFWRAGVAQFCTLIAIRPMEVTPLPFTMEVCVNSSVVFLQAEEPPYLSVDTDVSAKYKGAFCEAKIRKVVRSVKCKVSEINLFVGARCEDGFNPEIKTVNNS